MATNLKKLYSAWNPSATLDVSDADDKKFYIDFSSVRSGNLIWELKRTIMLSGDPTCQLFTGHIGCGKSTELLRLKADLEEQGFHTVYFESSEELNMGDIDITDILMLITRKISESLAPLEIRLKPPYFKRLFGELADFLKTEIDLSAGADFTLGLAKITAKNRNNPNIRRKLRDYLETRSDNICVAKC